MKGLLGPTRPGNRDRPETEEPAQQSLVDAKGFDFSSIVSRVRRLIQPTLTITRRSVTANSEV